MSLHKLLSLALLDAMPEYPFKHATKVVTDDFLKATNDDQRRKILLTALKDLKECFIKMVNLRLQLNNSKYKICLEIIDPEPQETARAPPSSPQ